jgi:2-polyprenyl-3-methyl-5-hydroxy-6-metoxy-1,4-benzoquinol methylase
VLEIGCGDAFATRIVQQTVKKVTVTDFDPIFIEEIHNRHQQKWGLDAHVHNMVLEPTKQSFDGIFSLDVLEHVQQSDEDTFLRNTCHSLNSHGALIIGMPSLESQPYASEGSKIGHVNCKTGTDLRDLMKKYFHSVFMFSMNDEVVHTGFFPMAHYLFAVCCDKK